MVAPNSLSSAGSSGGGRQEVGRCGEDEKKKARDRERGRKWGRRERKMGGRER